MVPLHGLLNLYFSSASCSPGNTQTNAEQAEEAPSLPQCNGRGESVRKRTPPLSPSDSVVYILREEIIEAAPKVKLMGNEMCREGANRWPTHLW